MFGHKQCQSDWGARGSIDVGEEDIAQKGRARTGYHHRKLECAQRFSRDPLSSESGCDRFHIDAY